MFRLYHWFIFLIQVKCRLAMLLLLYIIQSGYLFSECFPRWRCWEKHVLEYYLRQLVDCCSDLFTYQNCVTSKCGSFHVNICFVLLSTVVATSAQCWEYPFENDVISCGELHISGPMGIHLMNPYHPCPWVYFIFLSCKSAFLSFRLFCVV